MEKRGPGRPAYNQTPEQEALRHRARKHMRTLRPGPRHPQEFWIRAFVELYDQKAWEVLHPPMTRTAWLRHYGISRGTLSNFRAYLRVFDAAVAAGANAHPLRYVPYSELMALRGLIWTPNKLLAALLGEKAVKERRRKQANRAARRRHRAPSKTLAPSSPA